MIRPYRKDLSTPTSGGFQAAKLPLRADLCSLSHLLSPLVVDPKDFC